MNTSTWIQHYIYRIYLKQKTVIKLLVSFHLCNNKRQHLLLSFLVTIGIDEDRVVVSDVPVDWTSLFLLLPHCCKQRNHDDILPYYNEKCAHS